MSHSPLRRPNFGALVVLVWLPVALALLLHFWPQTAETLLDTDDAMNVAAGHGKTDGQYYEVAPPRSLGERPMIVARDRIDDDITPRSHGCAFGIKISPGPAGRAENPPGRTSAISS